MDASPRNELAGELSPYLLQHATNPVHWMAWGERALDRAREEQKPIFLSIGYSACHWCHVMERESFENQPIADLLNEHFVCIKVDREERPEVDELYMKAVQSLTGSGGWPLSVFLTPDKLPFYGGTYFPPYAAYGRPGFFDVVSGIARGWDRDPARAQDVGAKLLAELQQEAKAKSAAPLDADIMDRSLDALAQDFDATYGGFGDAPKFPRATDLRLCLRQAYRLGEEGERPLWMALSSLEAMAAGGIQDQLTGGFHRYCVDERWQVPHFEKMLYDSALLVPAYLDAYRITGREDLLGVARGTCDFLLAEMLLPGGGFASAYDADSEGEEGRFYTWTPDELAEVLGAQRGYEAAEWFGVDDLGHLEDGRSVLHRPHSAAETATKLGTDPGGLEERMEAARASLEVARRRRPRPGLDDKVLTAWNGLAIRALALTWQLTREERYLSAARDAVAFLRRELFEEGLLACWREGEARHPAGLDAYAYLLQGVLDLFESTFEPDLLRFARDLAAHVSASFRDPDGGYYLAEEGRDDLIVRQKSPVDGAVPAPGSVHVENLLRLSELTGDRALAEEAAAAIHASGAMVRGYPSGFSSLLLAADSLTTPAEIVIAGELDDPRTKELLDVVYRTYRPGRVVSHSSGDAALQPILEGKTPGADGTPLAYPCRNYACDAPLSEPAELADWLSSASSG